MVVCVVYWRCLKGAVVRLICPATARLQCTLEGVEIVVGTLDGSLSHWATIRGKKLSYVSNTVPPHIIYA